MSYLLHHEWHDVLMADKMIDERDERVLLRGVLVHVLIKEVHLVLEEQWLDDLNNEGQNR